MKALTEGELLGFDAEMMERFKFTSVLEHTIFPAALDDIVFLYNQFWQSNEALNAYCFDTSPTAWKEIDGEDRLVGGYNSPGFNSTIVNFLQLRQDEINYDLLFHSESRRQRYDLAFVNKHYTPMSPYARLMVDQELIDVMRKLGNGEAVTEDEYTDTDLRRFFDVGFKNQAALVLLPSTAKN